MTTLRFNFRGVGESEGAHDSGRGEVEDLAAAASWIRGLRPDRPLILVGYSFGSWCAVRLAAREHSVRAVVAIGLPVGIYPFEEIPRLGKPLAVVQASRDEFGGPDDVRSLLDRARPRGRMFVVEDTSHLFPKRAREAAARVGEAVRAMALFDAEPP
jgi:hypothetical protein